MISIFEAKDNIKCVCKDFEVIGNDSKAAVARQFLKNLKEKLLALGLTYEQCRDAAFKIKHGNLEAGLKAIWKGKVHVTQENSEDGYTSLKEYEVSGYGTFRESVNRQGNGYVYKITAEYKDNPNPSESLRYIADILIRPGSGDMTGLEERALRDTFMSKPCAVIYNFLFVCMDGYDMSSVLNRYHLRLKNKFPKA